MAPTAFLSLTISSGAPMAFARRGPPDVVVCLRGEHDLSTVAELSATLARAITLSDADLVVDLSRVGFMDASTVSVVVWARELLGARDRSLAVRSPSGCARRVLELCDLSDLIDPRFAEMSMIDRRVEATIVDSLPETVVAGSVCQQPGERLHRTTARRAGRRALRGRFPSGSTCCRPGSGPCSHAAG